MSDDVLDLEAARERRERGELPKALRIGTIVRRSFGLAPLCGHREIEVDSLSRIVRCRACSADLDPIDALAVIAGEWDRLAWAVSERKQLEAGNEALRDEERRIKARIRTARKSAPAVDGELAGLRVLEAAARAMGSCTSAIAKALRALDDLRARGAA